MFGSRRSYDNGRCVILFEVNSTSVGAGIASIGGGTPKLVWSSRFTFPLQQELDYTRFMRTMLASFLEVGMKVTTEGLPAILTNDSVKLRDCPVVVVLSAPWFLGSVREVRSTDGKKQSQGVVVSQGLLTNLLATAKDEFLASPEGMAYRDIVRAADILDADILDVRLDGYPFRNYAGKKTHELALSAYFSITSPEVRTQLDGLLDKVVPNARVHFTTATRVLWSIVHTRLPARSRLLLMETDGELTSLALVENGSLRAVQTFPIGTNHFVRSLVRGESSAEHARGALSLLMNKLDTMTGFPSELRDALTAWQDAYHSAVRTLVRGVTPPRNVVCVAEPPWEAWFTKLVADPWQQSGIRTKFGQKLVPLVPVTDRSQKELDCRLHTFVQGLSTARPLDS